MQLAITFQVKNIISSSIKRWETKSVQSFRHRHTNQLSHKSKIWYLIIVCVVQIFIIVILVLFHLIPNSPLSRRCMPVVHWVVGISSRTDIRSRGETSGTEEDKSHTCKRSTHGTITTTTTTTTESLQFAETGPKWYKNSHYQKPIITDASPQNWQDK